MYLHTKKKKKKKKKKKDLSPSFRPAADESLGDFVFLLLFFTSSLREGAFGKIKIKIRKRGRGGKKEKKRSHRKIPDTAKMSNHFQHGGLLVFRKGDETAP